MQSALFLWNKAVVPDAMTFYFKIKFIFEVELFILTKAN